MSGQTTDESLISKLIKILRISNEPLSAHAINQYYKLPYKKVQTILKDLEAEGVIHSLKTSGGIYYFIPDKYFKRIKNPTVSEKTLSLTWLEDMTNQELIKRKEFLIALI